MGNSQNRLANRLRKRSISIKDIAKTTINMRTKHVNVLNKLKKNRIEGLFEIGDVVLLNKQRAEVVKIHPMDESVVDMNTIIEVNQVKGYTIKYLSMTSEDKSVFTTGDCIELEEEIQGVKKGKVKQKKKMVGATRTEVKRIQIADSSSDDEETAAIAAEK